MSDKKIQQLGWMYDNIDAAIEKARKEGAHEVQITAMRRLLNAVESELTEALVKMYREHFEAKALAMGDKE